MALHHVEIVEDGPSGRPGVFVCAATLGLAWQIAESEAKAAKKNLLDQFPISWNPKTLQRHGWFFQFGPPSKRRKK